MLAELRRCNTIGSISGILFLISAIGDKSRIARIELQNRCALENGISINCNGAIAFLHYLGFLQIEDTSVIPMPSFSELLSSDSTHPICVLNKACIQQLTDDGIFDNDSVGFDSSHGRLFIRRSAFPLAYAAVRNFLVMTGVLSSDHQDAYSVTPEYELAFSGFIRKRRKKFTLEQLIRLQEEQSKMGLEAEEFVLKREQMRLPTLKSRIKRISDYDVSAGYDIVSFSSVYSHVYDRFIEVKTYIGSPHFYWSENEVDTAKQKGDKYILCLVDYKRIGDDMYTPEYISDPYHVIFSDETWMVNTSTYRIQKV